MLSSIHTEERLELTVKTSSLSTLHEQDQSENEQYAIVAIALAILLAEEAERGEAVEGD
jgi:hypothetical protein